MHDLVCAVLGDACSGLFTRLVGTTRNISHDQRIAEPPESRLNVRFVERPQDQAASLDHAWYTTIDSVRREFLRFTGANRTPHSIELETQQRAVRVRCNR